MLDWRRFESLPGAVTENFEKLCRGVVKRHFASCGSWHELKNQPGVEFYILLNKEHSRLGTQGEFVGWQCKWFSYKVNGELRANEKRQIEDSLDKTKTHVPDINHWILWTHKTLAKTDQEWFQTLEEKYGFSLHLWNQADLAELLSGVALDLKNSYFGDLALTDEMLLEQHSRSIAPIKERWLTNVHQTTSTEKTLRRILGEKEAWDDFLELEAELANNLELICASLAQPAYKAWKDELNKVAAFCNEVIEYCKLFHDGLKKTDIVNLLSVNIKITPRDQLIFRKLLLRLRSNNMPLSLVLTNCLVALNEAVDLFKEAKKLLSHQFIIVVADAGSGKTQLAAEISASNNTRPAGIFILGRQLRKGMSLDNLATRLKFYEEKVQTFDALISAVNAAGERVGCRLPIVIDGLNEAEDLRDWKDLLESQTSVLSKYPYVVLICTTRDRENKRYEAASYQEENAKYDFLPSDAYIINLPGFDENLTREAVAAYFYEYKIRADLNLVPFNLFSHPLTLKIFCDVTNRSAKDYVTVSSFPSSIYSLLSGKIDYVASSIASMANLQRRYTKDEVLRTLFYFGEVLYESDSRAICEAELKSKIQFPAISWDSDIVNLLAQEGVILRDQDESFNYELTSTYDRLGGFIVADYLLRKKSSLELQDWLAEKELIDKLFGYPSKKHPLAEDILHALVAVLPQRYHGAHLYKHLPEKYQNPVLDLTPLIDKEYLNDEIIDKYKVFLLDGNLRKSHIYTLLNYRRIVKYPLNIKFLSEILSEVSITDRDLLWSEIVRENSKAIIAGLRNRLKTINKEEISSSENEIIYISWFLTSSVIQLRDLATELLVHLGRINPRVLFDLTLERLCLNDPYVYERLLAASYAVASVIVDDSKCKSLLETYSKKLYDQLFNKKAKNPTTHLLAREYASCTIKVILHKYPELASDIDAELIQHPYPDQPRTDWQRISKDKFVSLYGSPLMMDFENYSIGNLIKGRQNYDYSNQAYIKAKEKILWRIEKIGWNDDRFKSVDQLISTDRINHERSIRPSAERYGKKYSWIAYYELAGKMSDEDRLDYYGDTRFATDIDPFFPKNNVCSKKIVNQFVLDSSISTKEWIAQDDLPGLSHLVEIFEDGEDWTLLHGFLSEDDKSLNRNFYCSIETCFTSEPGANKVVSYFDQNKMVVWPTVSENYRFYIGEYYHNSALRKQDERYVCIEVGTKVETFLRPSIDFSNSYVSVSNSSESLQREVPIMEEVSVLATVVKYAWEGMSQPFQGTQKYLLAPWIVEMLDLKFDPIEGAYTDESGNSCVLIKSCRGATHSNYANFLYLRKDLLSKLKNGNKVLLRDIKVERRYSEVDSIDVEHSYSKARSISIEKAL